MENTKKYSVWLMPKDNEAKQLLFDTISSLSDSYGSSSFLPHMTLFSGQTDDIDKVIGLFKTIPSDILPLEMNIKGVNFTDDYFRTLFLEFETNKQLNDKLSTVLNSFLENGVESSLSAFPHLSLLYAIIDKETKSYIKSKLSFDFTKLKFDKIALVSPSSKGWQDIESWQILENL